MTRILVIEDDSSVRDAIAALLSSQNHAVTFAESGQLGAEAFLASTFDVVLVDIFLPGMDGLQTIKALRERAPTVPIIAMSGFTFRSALSPAPKVLETAIKLGATRCLHKPFGAQQLIEAINACLDECSAEIRASG